MNFTTPNGSQPLDGVTDQSVRIPVMVVSSSFNVCAFSLAQLYAFRLVCSLFWPIIWAYLKLQWLFVESQ